MELAYVSAATGLVCLCYLVRVVCRPRRDEMYENESYIIGPCMRCGTRFVGLCPLVVEARAGGLYIAAGTPVVCPPCWCVMSGTNPAQWGPHQVGTPKRPQGGSGTPRPTVGPKGGTGTPPKPSTPDQVHREMYPGRGPGRVHLDPDQQTCYGCCDIVGPMTESLRAGEPTGKFFCPVCVRKISEKFS